MDSLNTNMVKVLAFLLSNFYIFVAPQDNNTFCRPFPVMVPTDSTNQKFKIVHQCRGRANTTDPFVDPNNQCVNTTADPLDFKVDGETVYNHTKCTMATVCKLDQDIVGNLPSGVCYFHERWNATSCKCEMKDKTNHCKINSQPSTGAISSSSIQLNFLMLALVGEFIVFVSIGYIVIRWRKNQNNSDFVNEGIPFEREMSIVI